MIASSQEVSSGSNSRACRGGNSHPARLRSGMLCVFLAVCISFSHASNPELAAAQERSAGEYELKAAMLYNLIQFVEWPPSAYSNSQAPTVLCLLGWDPFGNSLTSLVSDKPVDGRLVRIRHLKDIDGTLACQILYISTSERRRLFQILSNLKGGSVLTVAEMDQFAAHGGMVQFSLHERRVLLEINLDAANRGGVKISSRLLAIARIVKGQDKGSTFNGPPTNSQGFESAIPQFPKRDCLVFPNMNGQIGQTLPGWSSTFSLTSFWAPQVDMLSSP